jgi:curved DNA-binding protein CbpA
MPFGPDVRLVVDPRVDLRSLPLTPVDFFVFSRVGSLASGVGITVAELVAASGQATDIAEASIAKLVELGVLRPSDQAATSRGSGSRSRPDDDQDLRRRARERRRGLLAAQMRGAQGNPAEPSLRGYEASSDEDSLPIPRQDQKQAQPVAEAKSILDTITPVPADDPRVDSTLELAVERQRQLLALRDQIRRIGHFEILGLEPVDDAKAIRRAYHVVSRDLHPDSFYGKEIGPFRSILDDLFRRARSSYEFLLDDPHRKTLVDSHVAQIREEQERRQRAELEVRATAAKAEAAAEAERQREAEAAAERARRARAERDRARQLRLRDRALAERRKQAAAHASQGEVEREAGRFGTAATLFRLAHEEDPSNPEYEREWRDMLAIARRQRAELSFRQGQQALAAGFAQAAAHHFAEAAEADPSLRNLAEAAGVMADFDPARARSFAMAALEALQQAQAQATSQRQTHDPKLAAIVHQACARAFLAAGQVATAREQAERAHQLLNNKQTRALLNSIKLT